MFRNRHKEILDISKLFVCFLKEIASYRPCKTYLFKREAVLKFEDLWYTFRRVFWDHIFFSGGFEVHMGYNDLALRWNPRGQIQGRYSRFRKFSRFGWILTRFAFLAVRLINKTSKPRQWFQGLPGSPPMCQIWNFAKFWIYVRFWPPQLQNELVAAVCTHSHKFGELWSSHQFSWNL